MGTDGVVDTVEVGLVLWTVVAQGQTLFPRRPVFQSFAVMFSPTWNARTTPQVMEDHRKTWAETPVGGFASGCVSNTVHFTTPPGLAPERTRPARLIREIPRTDGLTGAFSSRSEVALSVPFSATAAMCRNAAIQVFHYTRNVCSERGSH